MRVSFAAFLFFSFPFLYIYRFFDCPPQYQLHSTAAVPHHPAAAQRPVPAHLPSYSHKYIECNSNHRPHRHPSNHVTHSRRRPSEPKAAGQTTSAPPAKAPMCVHSHQSTTDGATPGPNGQPKLQGSATSAHLSKEQFTGYLDRTTCKIITEYKPTAPSPHLICTYQIMHLIQN